MYIQKLRIKNLRSFEDSEEITLSNQINILIGANNSGKSVIIKSLYNLQDRSQLQTGDIRIGAESGEAVIYFADIDNEEAYLMPHSRNFFDPHGIHLPQVHMRKNRRDGEGEWEVVVPNISFNSWSVFNRIPREEPRNYIYPYLSKRKVPDFSRTIDRSAAIRVPNDLSNIVARIDMLAERNNPLHEEYREYCKKILKLDVSSFPSTNGKQAGLWVNQLDNIPLESMGEGVSNLLGLITYLCFAKNKLFLIEEIENDIHPTALKNLLDLIILKSETNQFVISTHSNIVTKILGSHSGTKLHRVDMSFNNRMPLSIYSEVGSKPEERQEVLKELGYELFDYDLWEGWIFLEESTAEKIIREYLIKWFVQGLLNKVKTLSSGGVDSIGPRFVDFDRLFLFTHLEPIYKDKAWVVVDGDVKGKEVIQKLKSEYPSWSQDRFRNLTEENFEKYYPPRFSSDVEQIIAMNHGNSKQQAKKDLLNKVEAWIIEDEEAAKAEFKSSADEVIKLLQDIEAELG